MYAEFLSIKIFDILVFPQQIRKSEGMHVVLIDNRDSFTFNVEQQIRALGAGCTVVESRSATVSDISKLRPDRIVISPGPGRPEGSGVSLEVLRRLSSSVPILGVCLGHQCMGQVFGGEVIRASRLMHGKTSPILHNGEGVFAGLPNPFEATRYHSLVVKRETFPDSLEITAETAEKEIMGLRHREFPMHGVQFHPESILTLEGKKLLGNFLTL